MTDAYSRAGIAGVAIQVRSGDTVVGGGVTDAAGRVQVDRLSAGSLTVSVTDGDAGRPGGAYPSTAVRVEVGGGTSYVAATLSRIVPVSAPSYDGPAVVGHTLTAAPGDWQGVDLSLGYQWLRDGAPIPGATARTYTPTAADTGRTITVRVLASAPGAVTRSSVSPKAVQITARSTTTARISGAGKKWVVVRVKVTAPGASRLGGTVRLRAGDQALRRSVGLRDGTVEVRVPRATARKHRIFVEYGGQGAVLPSHTRTDRV